jgi:LPXTG-motif cell wall-anchored protein
MPEFRRGLTALAATVALACAPAAAYAQGAGDDQYEDPFGDEAQQEATPAPTPRRPAATATPAPVQPAATATPQPPSATATPAPTLPYTGVDESWPLAIAGALLLGAGITLRARLREPD